MPKRAFPDLSIYDLEERYRVCLTVLRMLLNTCVSVRDDMDRRVRTWDRQERQWLAIIGKDVEMEVSRVIRHIIAVLEAYKEGLNGKDTRHRR